MARVTALIPRPGFSAGGEWADAQLLLRLPDEAEEWPLTPHVDDVVVMQPALRHSASLNTRGKVRYAVYFRLLHASSSSR